MKELFLNHESYIFNCAINYIPCLLLLLNTHTMRSNQTQLRCREIAGVHVFNQTQIQYRDWVSWSMSVQPGTAPVIWLSWFECLCSTRHIPLVWLSWFQHKCSTRSRFGIVSELVPTHVFNQAQLWHHDWVFRAHVFNQIQSWPDEVDSMACVQTRYNSGTVTELVPAHVFNQTQLWYREWVGSSTWCSDRHSSGTVPSTCVRSYHEPHD